MLDEWFCEIAGREIGPLSSQQLKAMAVRRTLQVGDVAHLPPGALHRLTAVSDVVFAEASSAAPGWREDVVRLADRYGRDGTSTP